jgi:hypothetical protein
MCTPSIKRRWHWEVRMVFLEITFDKEKPCVCIWNSLPSIESNAFFGTEKSDTMSARNFEEGNEVIPR